MTLDEMLTDPKNKAKISLASPSSSIVCDPCQTNVRGALITSGNKSEVCWSAIHTASDCKYAWCTCVCHKGERDSHRLERATQFRSRPETQIIRQNGMIGQRILVCPEGSGEPEWMIMLPNGELLDCED